MPSYPEGWEFLGDMPDPWEPPEELRKSGRSSMLNLIIEMISSTFIGNDILQAAGKVLAEYAAFNEWCSPAGAGRLDFEQQTRRSLEISYLTRDVYTSWRAFADRFGPVRSVGWAVAEREALLSTLRRAESELRNMRNAS
jgi:hypothetical protein